MRPVIRFYGHTVVTAQHQRVTPLPTPLPTVTIYAMSIGNSVTIVIVLWGRTITPLLPLVWCSRPITPLQQSNVSIVLWRPVITLLPSLQFPTTTVTFVSTVVVCSGTQLLGPHRALFFFFSSVLFKLHLYQFVFPFLLFFNKQNKKRERNLAPKTLFLYHSLRQRPDNSVMIGNASKTEM